MGAIGLAEAARLAGKNQSTIHRAMKAGRLSYTRDEAGERRIDVAELERVFGVLKTGNPVIGRGNGASPGNDAGAHAGNVTHGRKNEGILAAQRETIDHQAATIADLRETIRDLRARLDLEVGERRQLIALLSGPERRPWWRRWWR
jgi:hypothetical protein